MGIYLPAGRREVWSATCLRDFPVSRGKMGMKGTGNMMSCISSPFRMQPKVSGEQCADCWNVQVWETGG